MQFMKAKKTRFGGYKIEIDWKTKQNTKKKTKKLLFSFFKVKNTCTRRAHATLNTFKIITEIVYQKPHIIPGNNLLNLNQMKRK